LFFRKPPSLLERTHNSRPLFCARQAEAITQLVRLYKAAEGDWQQNGVALSGAMATAEMRTEEVFDVHSVPRLYRTKLSAGGRLSNGGWFSNRRSTSTANLNFNVLIKPRSGLISFWFSKSQQSSEQKNYAERSSVSWPKIKRRRPQTPLS